MYALMGCSRGEIYFFVTFLLLSSFTVSGTCESEARKQEKYVQRAEEVTP